MSREFDFVVFGATGFTGKYVCAELQREIGNEGLKWAIAGRNPRKLEGVLDWMIDTDRLTPSARESVGIITADVDDQQSLFQMCKKARVCIDCVGPYRLYGEPVVKACVDAQCDYVDISGEPEYLEKIEHKYHEQAVEKGIYIIGACGFDCIPSDLGVVYAKKNFPGTLTAIENYFALEFGPKGMTGNIGTYATLVHSARNVDSLKAFRRSRGLKRVPHCGPKLKTKGVHYNSRRGCYSLPFPGADPAIVRRSQRYFYEKCNQIPVQFGMYFAQRFTSMILLILFGIVLKLFTLTSWGTRMMLNNPKFFTAGGFSFDGPTEEQMEGAGFNFMMYCKGYKKKILAEEMQEERSPPDQEMVLRISGPEIGYVLTSITLVQSAICIVKERFKLPANGGAYSPASAFGETSMLENLQRRGMKFEVISK